MKLAAAVIAGGKSKRPGVDKNQLKLEGRTQQLRLLEAMDLCRFEPLILNAFTAPEELPGWVSLVPDDAPGQGPLGSLASLLRRVDRPVLVASTDLPGLDQAALAALAQAYQRDPGLGLVARGDDGWHPLFAVYHPDLLPQVEAALAKGELSLQGMLEGAGLAAWTPPQKAWLAQLDPPASEGR